MPDIPIPEYACLRAISSASFFRRPGRRAVATTRRHLLWSAPQHVTLHKYRHLGNREFHYTLPRPLRACSACEHAWQHCSTLSSKDLKDIIRKPILPRANLICAVECWPPRQPAARKRVITFASPRQSRPIPPPEFAIGYVLILMFRPTPHGDHGEGDQRQHIEPRNISQEVPLVRKTFVILAVAATIGGAALSPTDAFARWGGVGWGGGGWRGGVAIGRVGGWGGAGWGWRRPGWGWRGPGWGWGAGVGFVGAPILGVSCWRWAPTVWGPARVWVC